MTGFWGRYDKKKSNSGINDEDLGREGAERTIKCRDMTLGRSLV